MRDQQTSSNYMNQLDGLRAIAVLAVFAQHWLPIESLMMRISTGYLGVRLFFVLSGFLITGILIRCRSEMERGQALGFTVRNFYIRRALRIFPLYYGLVLSALIFNYGNIRDIALYHLAFLSNIKFALMNKWGALTPFWSLAVEEQFYLFWPWVILLTPAIYLRKIIISLILSSIVYRVVGVVLEWNRFIIDYQLISCMDALCLGALLAELNYSDGWNFIKTRMFSVLFSGTGILLMYIIFSNDMFRTEHPFRLVLLSLASSMVFFVVIMHAAKGISGKIGGLIQSKPMSYIGKISYGLYVLHVFTPLLSQVLGISPPLNIFLKFTIYSTVTICMATFSWYLFERPINNFKRHFPYTNLKVVSQNTPIELNARR